MEMESQDFEFGEGMIDLMEYIEGEVDEEPLEEEAEPQQQQLLEIEGITVTFPGQPNENQLKMMENIIRCLNRGGNVLIESPTGSGKTLAFLCAILAWVDHHHLIQQRGGGEPTKPKIFYTVKTHAQVSAVVKELRKTIYAAPNIIHPQSNLKVSILGSRRQLCRNQDVIRNESQESRDDACKRLQANFELNQQQQGQNQQPPLPTCQFYKVESDDYFTNHKRCANGAVRDIEDMISTSVNPTIRCCPYFGSRRQLPSADIVICPYNYVTSAHARNSVGIHSNNSILIFDEGHNLDSVCCEEGSISINLQGLRQILDKCSTAIRHPRAGSLIARKIQRLSELLRGVWEWMGDTQTPPQTNADVLNAFRDLNLGPDNITDMENDVDYVINAKNIENEATLDSGTTLQIKKFVSVLKYLYTRNAEGDGDNDDVILKNYFLQLQNVEQVGAARGSPSSFSTSPINRRLNIICLKASVVFQQISNQTRSVLVTSATLSPLDTFPNDLGITFEDPLSLEQTIPTSSYWITKVGSGPTGLELQLKSSSSKDPALQKEVGQLVLKLCQTVPYGVLMFFPSKQYLERMKSAWELEPVEGGVGTIMNSIKHIKHVVSETDMNSADKTRELLTSYRDQSKTSRGAVLFGIHRGKLSEGVDFKDDEARAVISFGIPFAPPDAPPIFARRSSRSEQEFWRWYNTNAIRALSQCLGRSVRHQEDWGAIIMVDNRLIDKAEDYSGMMPRWIEAANNNYDDLDETIRCLRRFAVANMDR